VGWGVGGTRYRERDPRPREELGRCTLVMLSISTQTLLLPALIPESHAMLQIWSSVRRNTCLLTSAYEEHGLAVELPMKLPPTAQRPSPWMNFSPVTQWPSVQRRRYGGKEREKSEAPSVDRSLLTHMHAHTQTNKGGQGIGQTPYKIFDGQNETEEITRHLMNSHLRELILSHICRIRWEGRKTIR